MYVGIEQRWIDGFDERLENVHQLSFDYITLVTQPCQYPESSRFRAVILPVTDLDYLEETKSGLARIQKLVETTKEEHHIISMDVCTADKSL